MTMNQTAEEKEAVLHVFARLVRPLMRLAFEYGITAGEISGLVRRVYIEALESRLAGQNRPTTDARLAAVAGLARSDVAALRDQLRSGAPHSGSVVDQTSALLTTWSTHPSFSGAYGVCLDLPQHKAPGSSRPSFDELASIACPDVDPDTLLEQLIAAGSVELADGQTVRCLSRAYVPRGSEAAVTRIERVGRYMEGHCENFVHNLMREENEPVYFERVVTSDEVLADRERDSFLAAAGERGQEFLGELDNFLSHLPPSAPNATGKRYGVGLYFFEEPATNGPVARSVKTIQSAVSNQKPIVEEIDVLAPPRRRSE